MPVFRTTRKRIEWQGLLYVHRILDTPFSPVFSSQQIKDLCIYLAQQLATLQSALWANANSTQGGETITRTRTHGEEYPVVKPHLWAPRVRGRHSRA
jgi:hypothetical protein